VKTLLKILYALSAVALGALVSVWLVHMAVSDHAAPVERSVDHVVFVDHIAMMKTWFEDFRNRETHFHDRCDRVFLPIEEQESCLTCHSPIAHTKDERRRAFNNQHFHFMSCLVCHLDEERKQYLDYEWTSFGNDNSITQAGPYGLTRDGEGGLSGSKNFITKIVPVLNTGGRAVIYTPYYDERYQSFRQDMVSGLEIDEDEFREFAEIQVGKKALTCLDCHAEDTEFPFAKLGFSVKRVHELTHSAAVGMVEDYDVFHFPVVD
jgi:hypothetical protein